MRTAWLSMATAWLAIHGLAQVSIPRSPYAAISGVVLNDSTGTPLRRALVTLSTLDTPPLEAVTYSESNGAFGFTNVPPGKYHLAAGKDGFQSAWFGASTPKRPPGTMTLAAGDVRSGITFRLCPLGSISGAVLDSDGDPVNGAQVRLMRAVYERRKPAYRTQGYAMVDSSGRYRLDEVIPGEYILMVTGGFQAAFLGDPVVSAAQAAQEKMYAPQYYPDSARLSTAEAVAVAPGKDVEAIDFHLVARASASLHGKVSVPEEVPAGFAVQLNVFPQDVPETTETFGGGAAPPQYTFDFPNLLPGPYLVVASFDHQDRHYRAAERVEVPPGGQEISLHLERGIELPGRVDLEGGGERPPRPLRVNLVSGDTPPVPSQPGVEVKPDGTFVIPDVFPGIWDINVDPVPKGGFIKSMRLGDEDVLTEDMVITPSTRQPLRIVVSSRGAVVKGTVTVPEGIIRSARARVLLAPSGRYEHVLSFYAIASADESGHFEFTGITPGRYKLFAFEELDPSSFEDPGFLKPFEDRSETFDVPEGGRLTREVRLIPAADVPARN